MPLLVCSMAAGIVGAASAQPVPDYGFSWQTIGAPGNRATLPSETLGADWQLGRVNRTYRMASTEVAAEQWLEFVDGYSPYWNGDPTSWELTSEWIRLGPDGYEVIPGADRYAIETSFLNAARFANWLHNEKQPGEWAFETGVYDMSSFSGPNPDGTWNGQADPAPGSKFWIPTRDQWVKASHYDPDRYGPGLEGYWPFSSGREDPYLSGLPWEGGETSAGHGVPQSVGALDVGSYPNSTGLWGLFDTSGGVQEWTTSVVGDSGHRWVMGSRLSGSQAFDRLDFADVLWPTALQGVRLASVPSPSSLAVFFATSFFAFGLSRRRD